MSHFEDPELELLGDDTSEDESTGSAHAFRTAPIFTGDALHSLGTAVLPQRALYGRVLAQKVPNFPPHPHNRKLYINTNAPFSALVCGVQGSGKSHSTSVLLESCLMKDARLGTLPEPLSAIVFHFDTAAGGGCVQPCEAAYLSSLDKARGKGAVPPEVTVLVLPSNLQPMKNVYAGLPKVRVEPLHFAPEDISGDRLLAMMKVEEGSQMPLYMEAIMSILRSMEGDFDYAEFRKALGEQQFNPGQKAMLNLRLSLLDSCLKDGDLRNRASTHFKKGHLTIIDLSSSFMDGSSACGFFDLILGLFIEADVKAAGKVIVLDEAHKYLSDTQSGTSSRLTDSLLSVIRQQRHLATRVIISTQEPTVVPSKFLDLCSFIIAHRFSSPTWLKLLAQHVSAADSSFDELFNKIVSLRTGQAIMFAASGVGMRESDGADPWHSESDSGVGASEDPGTVAPIGQGYLHVQSRLRVTTDGGHSILAVNDPEHTTRLGRVPRPGGTGGASADASSGCGGQEGTSHASPGGTSAFAEQAAGAAAPPCPQPAEKARQTAPATGSVAGGPEAASLAVILRPPPLMPPVPKPAPPSSTQAADKVPPLATGTDKAHSTPSVFVLTGALHKFRPLVAYLQGKLTSEPFGPVLMKTARKYFIEKSPKAYGNTFDGVLDEALQLGLIQYAPTTTQTEKSRIQLVPYADYPLVAMKPKSAPPPAPSSSVVNTPKPNPPKTSPPSTLAPAPASVSTALGSKSSTSIPKPAPVQKKMHLTGQQARFVPLVKYLLEQKQSGFTEITVVTIRKRFGPAVEEIIEDTVAQNIIRRVKAAKPKICLVPTTITW